jgi:hypothetical protein
MLPITQGFVNNFFPQSFFLGHPFVLQIGGPLVEQPVDAAACAIELIVRLPERFAHLHGQGLGQALFFFFQQGRKSLQGGNPFFQRHGLPAGLHRTGIEVHLLDDFRSVFVNDGNDLFGGGIDDVHGC